MGVSLKTPKKAVYFQVKRKGIAVFNDDFINTGLLDEKSVDLLVTSPPYNVAIDYGEFEDTQAYPVYLDFTRSWMGKAFSVLKEDGRFCLNIPLDKNKGGQQSIYADFVAIAKEIGFKYHSTIVWNEGNISRRTAWGSWLSASAPYVIAPVEMIVVMFKERWKKCNRGESDITKEDFIAWTNGLWTFSGESKKRIGHPAPFPVELPHRCIKLFTYKDDLVLDPFLGSGTTLVAAAKNGRKGIGFEIDPDYCEIAKNRLLEEAKIQTEPLSSFT